MTQTSQQAARIHHRRKCAFDFHEIRRVEVTQSAEARARLIVSSHEGRILPQALAEYFGKMPEVTGIDLDIEQGDEFEHVRITVHSHVMPHSWWLRTERLDVPTAHMDAPGFDVWRVCEQAVEAWRAHVARQQQQQAQ